MRSTPRFSTALSTAALILISARPAWAAVAKAKEKEPEPPPFQYEPGSHRDPFLPLVRDGRLVGDEAATQGTPVESFKPVLYGVLWDSGGQSIAVINDTEAKAGDMVGDYRLLEIRLDSVVLEKEGERMVLQLTFEAPSLKRSSGAPNGASTGGEGQ